MSNWVLFVNSYSNEDGVEPAHAPHGQGSRPKVTVFLKTHASEWKRNVRVPVVKLCVNVAIFRV